MPLERVHMSEQLRVQFGERITEARERFGVTGAGDDVLALRPDEEVAVWDVLARRRIPRERDTRRGAHVEVAEHHRLDADGGAEVIVDALDTSVRLGASAVP